jgi:hypothetical protein
MLQDLVQLKQSVARVQEEITKRMAPYEQILQRLEAIKGVSRLTAWSLVAELGVNMEATSALPRDVRNEVIEPLAERSTSASTSAWYLARNAYHIIPTAPAQRSLFEIVRQVIAAVGIPLSHPCMRILREHGRDHCRQLKGVHWRKC